MRSPRQRVVRRSTERSSDSSGASGAGGLSSVVTGPTSQIRRVSVTAPIAWGNGIEFNREPERDPATFRHRGDRARRARCLVDEASAACPDRRLPWAGIPHRTRMSRPDRSQS